MNEAASWHIHYKRARVCGDGALMFNHKEHKKHKEKSRSPVKVNGSGRVICTLNYLLKDTPLYIPLEMIPSLKNIVKKVSLPLSSE